MSDWNIRGTVGVRVRIPMQDYNSTVSPLRFGPPWLTYTHTGRHTETQKAFDRQYHKLSQPS